MCPITICSKAAPKAPVPFIKEEIVAIADLFPKSEGYLAISTTKADPIKLYTPPKNKPISTIMK